MAISLPARGQRDWDDELNNALNQMDASAEDAKSKATTAVSTANNALNVAQSVQVAVIGTANEATATFVTDEGPTKDALSATIAAQRDLISEIRAPYWIAHRGGAYVHPEHSMEAHRASAQAGFAPEPDLQLTSDGHLVLNHDETVDRTTYGTGTVASKTLTQFLALGVRPALSGGTGGRTCSFAQVLDEFGGRALLVPEPKTNGGDIAAAQAKTTQAAQMVKARGLQRAVVFTSFNLEVITAAQAQGCVGMWTQPNGLNSTQINDYINNFAGGGAGLVGCSSTTPQATVQAMAAAGLVVFVYGVTTPTQVTNFLSWGATGFWADDPWTLSDRFPLKDTRDRIQERKPWPNMGLTSSLVVNNVRFHDLPDRIALRFAGTGVPTLARFGNLAPIRRNAGSIEFTVKHLSGTGANSIRVALATVPDPMQEGSGSPTHYFMLMRRNGTLNVWSVTNNVATALTASSGDANPIGTAVADGAESVELRYRIAFTATTFVVTCLTTNKSQTFTNSDFAGPFYPNLGGNYDNGGLGGIVYNVVATEGT